MNNFINKIKERKIRKWLAIYISSAITIIGLVNLFSSRYNLPQYIFDILVIIVLFGFISVFFISWFHGKKEQVKIKPIEYILQTSIFLSAIFTSYFFAYKKEINLLPTNTKIIAVLPFANFNETNETEFFADGITDDILTQLSKISDLKVISRTSIMKFKNSKLTIPEIADELGAGSILEGSVRKSENKIRIVGQLIDANSDIHIWSETYDRELKDVFDIQTDIAERIAAALHAKLLPLEKEQINNKSTSDLDAYTFYLKGKHHYYNYTKEENENAINFFKKALEIDPNYALALAGISESYSQKVTKYWESKDWIDSALVYGKKSIIINPNLAEGYKALANAYERKDEFELSFHYYEKSIRLNPNYWTAIQNFGQLKMSMGIYDEAFYWILRANELAPDNVMGNLSVSMIYKNLNCNKSAILWAKKSILLDPSYPFSISYLGDLYLNINDIKNAKKYFEMSIKNDSNWVFGWFLGGRIEAVQKNYLRAKKYFDRYMEISNSSPEYFYAQILQKLNMHDDAKTILVSEQESYLEYLKKYPNPKIMNFILMAEIYAIENNKENAFKWWKTAIGKNFTDINRIKIYPYFDNLRNEPNYKMLLIKMQSKIDSFQAEVKNKYPEYFDCK
ncbi:MAG: hypothetical protein WAR79_18115 [Melioribacteraceae bacterium]